MDKNFLPIGLLAALVLLSGCIGLEYKEVVNEQGMSTITMKMDLTTMPSQPGMEEADLCESMMQQVAENPAQSELQNIQCTSQGKIVTISGNMDRKGTPALTIDGDKYKFDLMTGLNTENQDPETFRTSMEQMKMIFTSFDYYVKLPGRVTSQVGGEIQSDGSVKFNVLELGDEAYLESTLEPGIFGMDPTTLMIAGAVIVVVLVVIVIVLLKR